MECRILISIGGEDVFRYGGADPEAALLQTLSVLNRLLQPEMGDSAPLYVGEATPFPHPFSLPNLVPSTLDSHVASEDHIC